MNTGIEALDGLKVYSGSTEYKLDTPLSLMSCLGNPQDKLKTIHVAGTNGKGSVCCYLAAGLYEAGFRVGQMCSPHLSDISERLLVGGRPVSRDSLSSAVDKVLDAAGQANLEPSFFETLTAACFLLAEELQLDYLIVEVGLGGRLDATNVISKASATVITSIGLDHMAVLGETLELIAAEKAGILKSDVPVFLGYMDKGPREVILNRAREVGAPVKDPFSGKEAPVFAKEANQALASEVLGFLGLSDAQIASGLKRAFWPGRLERISYKSCPVLFDVFHNSDGVSKLSSFLRTVSSDYNSLYFLLSFLDRKDYPQMIESLKSLAESLGKPVEFVFTESDHGKVVPAEVLRETAGLGIAEAQATEALEEAVSLAKKSESSESSPLVVIGGSLFLVGLLRPYLVDSEFLTIR